MTETNALNIDILSLPVGAVPDRDRIVGWDEFGNPVRETIGGVQYAVYPVMPQNALKGKGVWDRIAMLGEGIVQSAWNGFMTPGRAASGEPVTYGDVLDTAGLVQLGAAAMPAPKNALRSGSLWEFFDDDVVDYASRGDEVLSLLKSGRFSEITDDLLDLGDPAENAKLNSYIRKNYDLPMDEASRLARAESMGFDTSRKMYHGSRNNFEAFDPGMQRDPGVWMTTDMSNAASYSEAGGGLYDLYTRNRDVDSVDFVYSGDGNLVPQRAGQALTNTTNESIVRDSFDGGAKVVEFPSGNFSESGFTRVVRNPEDIRLTSARFDPRLAHLRNLSAAIAGGVYVGGNSMDDRRKEIINYLATVR